MLCGCPTGFMTSLLFILSVHTLTQLSRVNIPINGIHVIFPRYALCGFNPLSLLPHTFTIQPRTLYPLGKGTLELLWTVWRDQAAGVV